MLKELYYYFLIKRSGLFDCAYYLHTNPDVHEKDIDPILHFIKFGWREGRNPSPEFDTNFYLQSNQDVLDAAINPLVHYIKFGKDENRLINKINLIKTIPATEDFDYQFSIIDNKTWENINENPFSKKVDIIICVGPNPDNIKACLESINNFTEKSTYNLHLIIHKEDFEKIADIVTPDINVHLHEMALFNYSRANNMVMRHSTNDVVLLNDDTEVTKDWLIRLRNASKGVALTGAHTDEGCSGNPDMYGTPEIKLTNFPINMFCAFIPRRIRQVVGLLDEEFVYYGGEDVDYSIRARMHGFPLVISDAYVIHKDNQSFREKKEVLIKESDKVIFEKYSINSPFNLSMVLPKVSIIMATRNRPHLLKTAIESIEKLNYKNFELIIVDDCSEPDTNTVILAKQKFYNNIVYIRLSEHQGAAKARMIGVHASQGQFILFTDDDDTVLSNRINKPLEYIIINPILDVVYCHYNVINKQGGPFPIYCQPFNYESYLAMEFYIGLGTLLGRKKAFIDVPLQTRFNAVGDYDWVFRLLRKGYTIDLCPEIVMNYSRLGSEEQHLSMTSESADRCREVYNREKLLEKMSRKP